MPAALFPPRAEEISGLFRHVVSDGEAQVCGDESGILFGIRGCREKAGTDFRERSTAFFIALKEPSAEGSPMSAIEKNDRVVRLNIVGQRQRAAVGDVELDSGERVHEVQFLGHVWQVLSGRQGTSGTRRF